MIRVKDVDGDPIPLTGIGKWGFKRHFSLIEYQEIVQPNRPDVEEWFVREAHHAAARASLTILREYPIRWQDSGFDGSKLASIEFSVRHEPQADKRLINEVARAMMRVPPTFGGIPDVPAMAEIAVRAVRDQGRLLASVPRPEGLPE